MKNKMAKIASIAAMMAVANGDEVYDCLPAANHKTAKAKRRNASRVGFTMDAQKSRNLCRSLAEITKGGKGNDN